MSLMMEYASKVFRTGKRGRPRLEPHTTVTLRMNNRIHALVTDYCIQHDISQREFIELAAETLVINEGFARRVKARRQALLERNTNGL